MVATKRVRYIVLRAELRVRCLWACLHGHREPIFYRNRIVRPTDAKEFNYSIDGGQTWRSGRRR